MLASAFEISSVYFNSPKFLKIKWKLSTSTLLGNWNFKYNQQSTDIPMTCFTILQEAEQYIFNNQFITESIFLAQFEDELQWKKNMVQSMLS